MTHRSISVLAASGHPPTLRRLLAYSVQSMMINGAFSFTLLTVSHLLAHAYADFIASRPKRLFNINWRRAYWHII